MHVKDSTKGCIANAVMGTGAADFYDSAALLKQQNYEGAIILENLYELLTMRHLNADYFDIVKEDIRIQIERMRQNWHG